MTGRGEKWLRRGLYCSGILGLLALWETAEAQCQVSVAISFALQDPNVSLHEPVYVNFSVRNELSEEITFDLGFDRKEAFHFSIAQPGGSTVELPRYSRGGIGLSGALRLGPGETYKQRILLNELYHITNPGEYSITVKLEAPVRTRSGREVQPAPPRKLGLLVGGRDGKRLAEACERLAKMATGADYEIAREAAFALRYVQDPVAVPYLDRVLKEGDSGVKGFATTGLARIGTPEAVEVLKSNLNTAQPLLKLQIEQALREISTGVTPQVLD